MRSRCTATISWCENPNVQRPWTHSLSISKQTLPKHNSNFFPRFSYAPRAAAVNLFNSCIQTICIFNGVLLLEKVQPFALILSALQY